MIHDFDIARWLFGEVIRVHAHQRGHLTAPAPDGAVASGTAVLTHESGVITQVVGVWAPPNTPFRTTFHVSGTGGTLSHDSLDSPACGSPAATAAPPERRESRRATSASPRTPPR